VERRDDRDSCEERRQAWQRRRQQLVHVNDVRPEIPKRVPDRACAVEAKRRNRPVEPDRHARSDFSNTRRVGGRGPGTIAGGQHEHLVAAVAELHRQLADVRLDAAAR
jgi:hypothetical protein